LAGWAWDKHRWAQALPRFSLRGHRLAVALAMGQGSRRGEADMPKPRLFIVDVFAEEQYAGAPQVELGRLPSPSVSRKTRRPAAPTPTSAPTCCGTSTSRAIASIFVSSRATRSAGPRCSVCGPRGTRRERRSSLAVTSCRRCAASCCDQQRSNPLGGVSLASHRLSSSAMLALSFLRGAAT